MPYDGLSSSDGFRIGKAVLPFHNTARPFKHTHPHTHTLNPPQNLLNQSGGVLKQVLWFSGGRREKSSLGRLNIGSFYTTVVHKVDLEKDSETS